MMRNLLIAVFCLCFLNFSFSQQPTYAWAGKFNGNYSTMYPLSISTDGAGNVYTFGQFDDTTDFDPGPGVYNLPGDKNHFINVFISKCDASGHFIWAKALGYDSAAQTPGTYNVVYCGSGSADINGNVYITGPFVGTIDFDPSPGIHLLSNGNAYICKLDSAGNYLWAKNLKGVNSTSGTGSNSITSDNLGNIYTFGYFNGTVDFDPDSSSTFSLTTPGYTQYYISKLDAAGNFVWAKNMGKIVTNLLSAVLPQNMNSIIKVDAAGNVYSTGYYEDTADFDPGPGVYNLMAMKKTDLYITKLNAAGNFVWAKSMGGINDEFPNSLALDAAGNVYTTGWFKGTADFNPDTSTFNLTSKGGMDIFISKLNSFGDFVWAKRIGATNDQYTSSLALDNLKNIYITGETLGVTDFDPGPNVFNITSPANRSTGFISKYDSSGNFIWANEVAKGNSNFFADGYFISVDQLNNLFATGRFYGTGDFDPSSGIDSVYYGGGFEAIYILKLGQSTLPLQLLTFTAIKQKNSNLLQWKTEREINTDHFEIEKSLTGNDFSKIGTVKAGASIYTYTDNYTVTTGSIAKTTFYRLKMFDKDGTFSYSPIKTINHTNNSFAVNIYPNPTITNELKFQLESDQKAMLQVRVISKDGKVVLSSQIASGQGASSQTLNISKLPSGQYFLNLTPLNQQAGGMDPVVVSFEKN